MKVIKTNRRPMNNNKRIKNNSINYNKKRVIE